MARWLKQRPCLLVTLTGTMSGPVLFNGVAGAGPFVRYGNDGGAVKLQFDTGRVRMPAVT
jgi:ribonuclease Z